MLENINLDKTHRFAWTKGDATKDGSISREDIFSAADDLLTNTPEADVVLILYKGDEEKNIIYGKLKGSKNKEVLSISKLFGGGGTTYDAFFEYHGHELDLAEKNILKTIADAWQSDDTKEKQNLWDMVEEGVDPKFSKQEPSSEIQKIDAQKNTRSEIKSQQIEDTSDAIEEALKSISQSEKDKARKEFTAIRDVIDKKKQDLPAHKAPRPSNEIDVFDEDE
jgi:hypothetical protein